MSQNIAVIFAGGSGERMKTVSKPKQFLEFRGKPIIIYTLELFDNHPDIDGIIVVCIEPWIPFLQKQLKKFEITKVSRIVPGGPTGQISIFNGLKAANEIYDNNATVLIHDGVRPLITEKTISDNVTMVAEKGNCITCVPTTETFVVKSENGFSIPNRENSFIARAPQSFILKDILEAHNKAKTDGFDRFIDSCTLMSHYGYKLNLVYGPVENIKITTPSDFFIFKTMVEIRENQQIFGY